MASVLYSWNLDSAELNSEMSSSVKSKHTPQFKDRHLEKGPPFTRQQEVQKMVYSGETSCEQDMEWFVESVKYVITSYKMSRYSLIPWDGLKPGAKGAITYVTSEYDFTVSGAGKMKRDKRLKRREHE